MYVNTKYRRPWQKENHPSGWLNFSFRFFDQDCWSLAPLHVLVRCVHSTSTYAYPVDFHRRDRPSSASLMASAPLAWRFPNRSGELPPGFFGCYHVLQRQLAPYDFRMPCIDRQPWFDSGVSFTGFVELSRFFRGRPPRNIYSLSYFCQYVNTFFEKN